MSEGEWIDLAAGKAILEAWFACQFAEDELKATFRKLMDARLVSCQVNWREATVEQMERERNLETIEFKASGLGVVFLQSRSGQST